MKVFKICSICIAAFISLNVQSHNSYAKELNAKNFEEMEEMLSEARRNASEEEPYVISIQAGEYDVDYEISIPSYTTLNFEKETKINYTGNGEYIIRIKSGSSDVTVNGGSFSDAGIIATGGDNITIENTVVNNPANAGIVFKGKNTNSSIIGNTVKNSERFSIALMGASFTGDIRENTITNSSDIALYFYNSKLKGDIYGNTIKDCKASGFYAGNTPIDGDFKKNTIKNVKGNGIGIYHGSHINAIDSNELIDIGGMHDGFNGDCGIHINADEGVGKKAKPTYAESITNNTLRNITYSGIALYSGPSGGKEDSKANQDKAYIKKDIKGNKLYNIGTYKHSKDWKKEIQKGGKIGTQVGIKLDTHARVYGDICNNVIKKSNQHGIYLRVGSVVKNIYNNEIEDVQEDGISIMESIVKAAVRNNKVTGAKRDGLFVRKGSVVNIVSGNTFKNITHKDIAIQDGGKIKKNI